MHIPPAWSPATRQAGAAPPGRGGPADGHQGRPIPGAASLRRYTFMRTIYTCCIATALGHPMAICSARIPNSGSEPWNEHGVHMEPEGWWTPNDSIEDGGWFPAVRSTDNHPANGSPRTRHRVFPPRCHGITPRDGKMIRGKVPCYGHLRYPQAWPIGVVRQVGQPKAGQRSSVTWPRNCRTERGSHGSSVRRM